MEVSKLPPVYGEGQVPTSTKKISFQGKVDVWWDDHTVPLLRAIDRALVGLPPIGPGKDDISAFSFGIHNFMQMKWTLFCHPCYTTMHALPEKNMTSKRIHAIRPHSLKKVVVGSTQ